MSVIVKKLNDLGCLKNEAAALDAAIAAAFPRRAALEAEIKALEGSIKDSAKFIPASQAHTLVGAALQLVWVDGGHVEYDRLPGWSIRKTGKK